MIWESAGDFFAMGGYALYVWGSFVVVFACMAGEVFLLRQHDHSIRAQLVKMLASRNARPGGKS